MRLMKQVKEQTTTIAGPITMVILFVKLNNIADEMSYKYEFLLFLNSILFTFQLTIVAIQNM